MESQSNVSGSSRPSATPIQISNTQHLAKKERKDSQLDRFPIPESQGRSSFSSIKENVSSGFAQSFTNSKTSSFSQLASFELAIDDAAEEEDDEQEYPKNIRSGSSFRDRAKMLMVPSFIRNHHHNERGANDVPIRSKTLSFDNLKDGWNSFKKISMSPKKNHNVAGESPLEKLPSEILTQIISHLALDIPPLNYTPRNSDLMSLVLTSSTMHLATLSILYRNVTIPHAPIYSKFLRQISGPSSSSLAQMVRRLDFSHFNPTMSGLSARERRETRNLTHESLLQGLELMTNLQEFLAQEHIDDDLSSDVLVKLFTDLPRLQALDLCACSSTRFRDSFATFIAGELSEVFRITRLSLHECTILPSIVYETLLPRIPNLTHLDVSHTLITDEALMSIPSTARITHLNLSKCARLSGDAVTEFLTTHPAIIGNQTHHHPGLVYLNLRSDAKTHSLLSPSNLSDLIPALPSTIRSLNLSGSKMSTAPSAENMHITALLPLTKHLEELSLGRNVPLTAVNEIFSTSQISTCTLRYLDISELGAEQGVSMGSLLDKHNCYLLRPWSLPLEVLEISEKLAEMCRVRLIGVQKEGWTLMEAGRRYWLVRDMRGVAGATVSGGVKEEAARKKDDGERDWKMGAKYWGMRKVPVARMEVGGMYGLYMFKR